MSVRDASASGEPSPSATTPPGTGTEQPVLGNGQDGSGPTSTDEARCERVCDSCLGDQLGENCGHFCVDVYDNAVDAGCTAALTSLFRCHDSPSKGCSSSACPAENNALTACVIDYCDGHFAPLCSAPL